MATLPAASVINLSRQSSILIVKNAKLRFYTITRLSMRKLENISSIVLKIEPKDASCARLFVRTLNMISVLTVCSETMKELITGCVLSVMNTISQRPPIASTDYALVVTIIVLRKILIAPNAVKRPARSN